MEVPEVRPHALDSWRKDLVSAGKPESAQLQSSIVAGRSGYQRTRNVLRERETEVAKCLAPWPGSGGRMEPWMGELEGISWTTLSVHIPLS